MKRFLSAVGYGSDANTQRIQDAEMQRQRVLNQINEEIKRQTEIDAREPRVLKAFIITGGTIAERQAKCKELESENPSLTFVATSVYSNSIRINIPFFKINHAVEETALLLTDKKLLPRYNDHECIKKLATEQGNSVDLSTSALTLRPFHSE